MLPKPDINFQRTPVTLILAAVAVALELACTFDDAQDGGRRLAYYNDSLGILPSIWAGELWRPFTTTLLHGGLLHAAFNCYWLVIFGSALENRFGPFRTLGLIVLLGYVSTLPQFIVSNYNTGPKEQIAVVGLSGVVYGLFGILLVGRRWQPELNAVCDDRTVRLLVGWFVLCIFLTHFGWLPVANIAHGAGLAFGILYGLAVFDGRRRLRWAAVATVATLLVLCTLIYCPGHAGYRRQRGKFVRADRLTSGSATASASWPAAWGCRFARRAGPGPWAL